MHEYFSYKIYSLIKQKGYTQEKLAEKSGLSKMSIRRYETGERQPKVEQLFKIANALEVPIVDLLENLHWDIEYDAVFGGLSNVKKEELTDEFIKEYYQISTKLNSVAGAWFREKTEKQVKRKISKSLKKLSSTGLEEAEKRVEELTRLEEYRLKEQEPDGSDTSE